MGVTVLIGGQYGSEGKGKISRYLADEFQMAIRTGGPNAGHSFEYGGKFYQMRSGKDRHNIQFVNNPVQYNVWGDRAHEENKQREQEMRRPGRLRK